MVPVVSTGNAGRGLTGGPMTSCRAIQAAIVGQLGRRLRLTHHLLPEQPSPFSTGRASDQIRLFA